LKKLCLLLGLMMAIAGCVVAAEEYPYGPDSQRQPGVPQGTVTQYSWTSKIFPGTVRDYWVYVPAQYTPDKPACVMVFEDGKGTLDDSPLRVPTVFDNLIAKHDMPVTIAIMINPGVLKGLAPGQADRPNRSYEYDSLNDRYARFLMEEILPEVAKHYNLSTNPNDRAISGASSGGICSFTVAWTHPEAFRRVLSFIGSFADLRGGDIYPALIRKTEPKPLRVFLQDGSHDLNNFAGDWWLANQSMASALAYAGYDVKLVTGDKDHDMIQAGAIFPDALRWLWRDYPHPIARPPMHPLGDPRAGFVDFVDAGSGWELVASLSPTSPEIKENLKGMSIAPLKSITGIAVDQQGNVFASNSSWSAIYRIAADGQASTFVADADGAGGVAFGPDGRLYGCDSKGIASYSSEGKKSVRLHGVYCGNVAFSSDGGLYFTYSLSGILGFLPAGRSNHLGHTPSAQFQGLGSSRADGICLSPDQSKFYVSDASGKWVWSYQIQADGAIANGEPYFRLETPDESSESGATGMAVDGKGLLYIATRMGIEVGDAEGRVVAILDSPESPGPEPVPISAVAFGGPDHQYLYVVAGSYVYRRHLVRRGGP